jgi:hypothetical protein
MVKIGAYVLILISVVLSALAVGLSGYSVTGSETVASVLAVVFCVLTLLAHGVASSQDHNDGPEVADT